MDARDVAALLAQQARTVASHLLPSGREIGRVWCAGSIAGETGDSLKLTLSGTHVGKWTDYNPAGGEHGDLLDLWSQTRGISIADALREAKSWLGIETPGLKGSTERTYRRPLRPSTAGPASAKNEAGLYLAGERGIGWETQRAFKVGHAPAKATEKGDWPGPWVLFPFFKPTADGTVLANIKWLHVERPEGKKVTVQERDAEPCLFGWQALDAAARSVTICEGEIDALTLHQYGIPALSIPAGAGGGDKARWVETEYENLERFDEIFICMDADDAGRAGLLELVQRLGTHRCRVVSLPRKDPNSCLVTVGEEPVSADEMQRIWARAAYIAPEELHSAGVFSDRVVRQFYPLDETEHGVRLRWEGLKNLRLRFGEVTLVTGINSHGKSAWLGQVAAYLADDAHRVFLASMEMKAEVSLAWMVQQVAGAATPAPAYIDSIVRWMDGRIWIYDVMGKTDRGRLIEVMVYARRRFGVRFFIIDSLMRCGIAADDYEAQGDFVDSLCALARAEGVHVILVVHPAKPKDESRPVGRLAMKGAGTMTDLAHNTIEVWRNKNKEHRMAEVEVDEALTGLERETKLNELRRKPDTRVIVDKQRTTGWEGTAGLWYDTQSRAWRDSQAGAAPIFATAPAPPEDEPI